MLIHPQEALLQEARALQQSTDYDQYRRRRVVAEHRLARLEQLGIRQARCFGRVRTKFKLYLAATVANLTLMASQIGVFGDPDNGDHGLATGGAVWRGSQRSPPPVANLDAGLVQVADGSFIALPNQGFPARLLAEVPVVGLSKEGPTPLGVELLLGGPGGPGSHHASISSGVSRASLISSASLEIS